MEVLDNKSGRVIDKLKENLKNGSKLSIISAYFTIYAYENLKKELNKIDKLRLLFSEPTFIKEKKDINREFKLSGSYERGIAGDRYEMKLKGELKQSEIAKECAEWIRKKVEIRARDEEYQLPQKMFLIENKKEEDISIFGSSDFTASGLGIVPSEKEEFNTYIKDSNFTRQFIDKFETYWKDKDKVKDVKETVLENLEQVYKENTPEFIYYVTLYNVFKDYLKGLTEEEIVQTKTGFMDSLVWNKLYNFQKDGVLGIIDKLEKYNGCILADSVGLGKTFEALAVIKYYELKNKRVLVLCPKKLRDNWLTYKGNRRDNILEKDRLNYDVLNHTDLSRYYGESGEIDLSKIYWENYDLIVIDESHNFRNNNNPSKEGKETRYSRLLEKIIKAGIKTKVLMLSATPVNNKMNDLKNQIAFATEGNDRALLGFGISSIEQTLRKAQMAFNSWNEKVEDEKTLESLLENLNLDYFKLLDMLTIARSRRHIQKYYDTSSIGEFPERLKPINIKAKIDTEDNFMELKDLNKKIRMLNMAMYSPIKYVLPHRISYYNKLYDTKMKNSTFRQIDREESLVNLMRVNILKRLESSVHSFGLTVGKLLNHIDVILEKLNSTNDIEENFDFEDLDMADPNLEDYTVGSKKVKVLINDIDKLKWRSDLEYDKEILEEIIKETYKISVSRDEKLRRLKEIIRNKINNPINENNKKILVFTAYSDTAKYLYENIHKILEEEGIYSAIVTGSDKPKTNLKIKRNDFNVILTNFSPKSKGRIEEGKEIDLLIATDCISEGQNLQDCDYLINYDIHWNPVRIIQRFGRIDRIGSENKIIQLCNFWPNMELDEYINLESRVSGRMVMLDMSATGEDNIIDETENSMNDLEYRKRQLKQLQDQVIDLEDINGNISITDLNFNDFKMDLVNFQKNNDMDMENIPTGMYAIAKQNIDEAKKGVIFCLKQINKDIKPSENNPLNPFFLVYIKDNGEILYNFIQSKKILDLYKKLCSGKNELYKELINNFNDETNNADNMDNFTKFLESTVENIIGKEEEKGLESLFSFGISNIQGKNKNLDDFELISFLVIK